MKRKLTDEEVTNIIKSERFQNEHRQAIKGFLSLYKTQGFNWVEEPEASKIADKFKHTSPDLTKPFPKPKIFNGSKLR